MRNLSETYRRLQNRFHRERDGRERRRESHGKIRSGIFLFFAGVVCMVAVGCRIYSGEYEMKARVYMSAVKKGSASVTSKLNLTEECYLCGRNSRSLRALFQDYEDLGIICVNEWFLMNVCTRNPDGNGNSTGSQGSMNITCTSTGKDGCFFCCNSNSDRGVSKATIFYGKNSILDIKKIRKYFCQNCLDKLWKVMEVNTPENKEAKPRDLCLVDCQTMELYSLQGDYRAYYVRDYYVQVDNSREGELKVTVTYAPVSENERNDGE